MEPGDSHVSTPQSHAYWHQSTRPREINTKETRNTKERERVHLLITKLVLAQILPKILKTKTEQSPHSHGKEVQDPQADRRGSLGQEGMGTQKEMGQPFRKTLNVLLTEIYQ